MAARDVIPPVISGRIIKDYFNAGCFLLNLKSLRKKNFNLLQTSLREAKKHKTLGLLDQDVLNLIFENNKEIVPPSWFYMMTYPCKYVSPDKIHVFHTFINSPVCFVSMHKEYVDLNNHYYKLVTGKDYTFKLSFKDKVRTNFLKFCPNPLIRKLRTCRWWRDSAFRKMFLNLMNITGSRKKEDRDKNL